MSKLVSVIVPAYNHARYIRDALDSVFCQTYQDIEIIAVDDCSDDNTFQNICEYLDNDVIKKRFVNIVIARNEQRSGAAATINRCMSMANGHWLTILNSDDLYHPERIAILASTLEDSGKQHAFTNLRVINNNGEEVRDHEFASAFLALPDRVNSGLSIGFHILNENIAHTSGNIFFSRSIQRKTGNFARLALCHDWDYLVRLLAWEEPVFVPEPLYSYRLHDGNTWSQTSYARIFDPMAVYYRYFLAIAHGNYTNIAYPHYGKLSNKNRMDYFKGITVDDSLNYQKLWKMLPAMEPGDRI